MCQNVSNDVLLAWFKFQVKMSIRNLIVDDNSVAVSYLIHYNSLLQIVTDNIAKCESYFITKCDRSLLQNASRFYHKMRQLLQIETILLQNAKVIRGHS